MSDEPVSPPPQGLAQKGPMGRRPLPGRPGGAPPRVVAPPPPSKFKKFLVRFILYSTVILTLLVGFQVYRLYSKKERLNVNVAEEWQAAFDKAKQASDEIQRAERKVWAEGKLLEADDRKKIEDQLAIMVECDQKITDLLALLRQKGKSESQEQADMVARRPMMKLWILDATDLIEGPSSPTEYGGFYIPLRRMIDRSIKAKKDLAEIEKNKEPLQAASEEEKEKVVQQIRKIEESLIKLQKDLPDLYDYVKKGLAMDDVGQKELPDLEMLTEEQATVGMVSKQARTLRLMLKN